MRCSFADISTDKKLPSVRPAASVLAKQLLNDYYAYLSELRPNSITKYFNHQANLCLKTNFYLETDGFY
jgi:hypothetical protein